MGRYVYMHVDVHVEDRTILAVILHVISTLLLRQYLTVAGKLSCRLHCLV